MAPVGKGLCHASVLINEIHEADYFVVASSRLAGQEIS